MKGLNPKVINAAIWAAIAAGAVIGVVGVLVYRAFA